MINANVKISVFITLIALTAVFGYVPHTQAAVKPELVSRAPNGDNGNGISGNYAVSADGRYVVFESNATNLIAGLNDNNGATDIFLRDNLTGTLRCLTGITAANPVTTGNGFSLRPIISASGRYVVFATTATDLVAGPDLNNGLDVIRYDTQMNVRELVSLNVFATGTGNGFSGNDLGGWKPYDMSDDGRYVAFMSNASDLTFIPDMNNNSDIFCRDMQTGITQLVSINNNITAAGNNSSLGPTITANGQLIAFSSNAGNLIPADNNQSTDIFVYNRQTQQMRCASLAITGGNVTGQFSSFAAVISRNGSRVAYFTAANDLTLVPIPITNPFTNVIVHDLGLGLNSLVSVNVSGTASGNNNSGTSDIPNLSLSISANGRYVAFESRANNLAPNVPSGDFQMFRRDLELGRTEVVSLNAAGTQAAGGLSISGQRGCGMSSDGRFITFFSQSSTLTSDFPGNFSGHPFVRDMLTGVTTALDLNNAGSALGNNTGGSPCISANGKVVIFNSVATDLTPANANNMQNVFRAQVPTPQRPVADFDGDGASDFALYRPGQGAWYVLNSPATSASYRLYGTATDLIVPADYNGDGRTDYAVFRPSNATWYISDSLSFGETVIQFGQTGDRPVPQDYDGDGRADLAVYRNGIWVVLNSMTGQVALYSFGLATDVVAPGDYDGDGKADLAVFRPAEGNWYIRTSTNGGLRSAHFGQNGDRAVPADYDGDGKTDLAVFRSGIWWILNSRDETVRSAAWGIGTDIPVAGSYDSDGKADLAVFRPANGNWYVLRSSNDELSAIHFGQNGDAAVAAALLQ